MAQEEGCSPKHWIIIKKDDDINNPYMILSLTGDQSNHVGFVRLGEEIQDPFLSIYTNYTESIIRNFVSSDEFYGTAPDWCTDIPYYITTVESKEDVRDKTEGNISYIITSVDI